MFRNYFLAQAGRWLHQGNNRKLMQGLLHEPAVEERPERGVATSVVVIFKHRPGLDGNGNDAIGLEPVRRAGETSRRALWDFFQ